MTRWSVSLHSRAHTGTRAHLSTQTDYHATGALICVLARLPAEYAQVTRMLGNGRLEAFCFDGVNRLCHIRGKLRKRVWIGVGDIILLGLREFQDQKADIIQKYDGDEARSLKAYGELPETVQINAGTEMLEGEEFGDDNFDFDEDADGVDDADAI